MNNVTLRRLAQAVLQHQARARERARASGIVVPVGVLGCAQRTKKELSALIRSKLGEPIIPLENSCRHLPVALMLGSCLAVVTVLLRRYYPRMDAAFVYVPSSVFGREERRNDTQYQQLSPGTRSFFLDAAFFA